MKIPLVDLKAQYDSIKPEIDSAMSRVIGETAFIGGKYVGAFEQAFAAYCGARYCIGVGNGTDALYIALRAAGVGPGDEVITVANSFVATSEAISMAGASVVFADCDPLTYTISIEDVGRKITYRTKAIIPVHLYGHPADMEALAEIAEKRGITLIEDAAQAHGAEIRGARTGSFGDLACFSFYPGKNLGAYGDGGAIVTNDERLAELARKIANHGRMSKYDHEFEGVNSRLDGLQAAILEVKLKHLEAWTEKRRAAAALYRDLLEGTPAICPAERDSVRHVYHLFVIQVKDRQRVQSVLDGKGIFTGVHYPIALPNLAAYGRLKHRPADFPVASGLSSSILSLPLYPELGEEKVGYICETLRAALN